MADFPNDMKFGNRFHFQPVVSEPGCRFVPTFHVKIDEETGEEILVEDGVFDLYEDIQAHAPEVDLHVILAQYKKTGEEALLNRRSAVYGDFTDVPKTFAEMVNAVHDGNEFFEGLPTLVKQRFGNSPVQFYSSFGKPEFNLVMQEYAQGLNMAQGAVSDGQSNNSSGVVASSNVDSTGNSDVLHSVNNQMDKKIVGDGIV